jgi:hypothetical protein
MLQMRHNANSSNMHLLSLSCCPVQQQSCVHRGLAVAGYQRSCQLFVPHQPGQQLNSDGSGSMQQNSSHR